MAISLVLKGMVKGENASQIKSIRSMVLISNDMYKLQPGIILGFGSKHGCQFESYTTKTTHQLMSLLLIGPGGLAISYYIQCSLGIERLQ